ncbi:MAG: hypothetical protein ACFB21_06325 [Opitutales bacterium]
MSSRPDPVLIDYRLLRALVGAIAFALPIVVCVTAGISLPSISDAYHTPARDWFVGLLFIVGAYLMVYNGHSRLQGVASTLAGLAAIVVALVPTPPLTPKGVGAEITESLGWLHFGAALVLFGVLTFFCFGPFYQRAKSKPGKAKRRARVYLVCGSVMIAAMAIIALYLIWKTVTDATGTRAFGVVFWGEWAALAAFGVAWLTAGKLLPGLCNPDERPALAPSWSARREP